MNREFKRYQKWNLFKNATLSTWNEWKDMKYKPQILSDASFKKTKRKERQQGEKRFTFSREKVESKDKNKSWKLKWVEIYFEHDNIADNIFRIYLTVECKFAREICCFLFWFPIQIRDNGKCATTTATPTNKCVCI